MKIKSIALYSDEDLSSKHVKSADEAYYLGPPAPNKSYLNIDRIIEIAVSAGAEAIHPGYGFLSENETFAKPDWVLNDVTSEQKYANSSLSQNPYKNWK